MILVAKIEKMRKKIKVGRTTDEKRYPHGWNAALEAVVKLIRKQ